MVRGGFTFIELVIAIVIMAIALMSVPLMLSQVNKSNSFVINQEAILAGATRIGDILTYPWDDKNVNSKSAAKILDVTNGDSELNRYPDNSSNRRVGNFKANYRRKFDTNITYASPIGRTGDKNSSAFDDMDDFNGTIQRISSLLPSGDYIKDINITTIVKYIKDTAIYSSSPVLNFDLNTSSASPTTNIKLVEVTVTDNMTHNKVVKLRAFSTNIGSYELLYRTFP